MAKHAARRVRAFLLTLFLLLGAAPANQTAADMAMGDCDGNGELNAADAAMLCRTLDALPGDRMQLLPWGDLTKNGTLNKTDVRVLLHMAAGAIPDLVSFVERISTGLLDESEFDHFSYVGVQRGELFYRSENVSISIEPVQKNKLAYFVADIYIQDLSSFKTATWKDFGAVKYQYVPEMGAENHAILAINGDFFKARTDGPIVRNSTWLQENLTARRDICVMTHDGVIRTLAPKGLRKETIESLNPYQTWNFGPGLLDAEGKALPYFRSTVSGRNPRTAIGYYMPGHYCFVLVDGRQEGYSGGLTLKDLAALFEGLDCTAAYNLDGGETSAMAMDGTLVNKPYRDGRALSDIVYIAEPGH